MENFFNLKRVDSLFYSIVTWGHEIQYDDWENIRVDLPNDVSRNTRPI